MLRTILILTALIVFSGKVFAGDSSDVVWKTNTVQSCIGVSISPDNTMVAHMDNQGIIKIYDLETGTLIKTIRDSLATNVQNRCSNGLDFSYDGKYLLGCKPFINKYGKWTLGLAVWNTDDWSIHYSVDSLSASLSSIYVQSFYKKSNRLAAVIGHVLYIIDVDKKETINKFDVFIAWRANQIEITDDDKYIIITGFYDKTDFAGGSPIIDTETGKVVQDADGFPIKTLLTRDKSKIICFFKDGVMIRDFTNKYTVKLYKYDFNTVTDVKMSPCGNYVVATTGLGLYIFKVGFWDTPYKYDNMFRYENIDISLNGEYIATGDPTVLKPRWETVSVNDIVKDERIKILYCSPNPAINSSTIKVISPEIMHAKITITDISGNQISTIYSGLLSQGENKFSIDCVSLSSGIYFCNLIAADINQSVKFVVNK